MIRTIAVNKNLELVKGLEISTLVKGDYQWFWIDFHEPSKEEMEFLRNPLSFHPLAIEDCIHHLQRPKLDYYEDYAFFVIQALNQQTIAREEVDFFLSKNYVVTFHHKLSPEINEVWNRFSQSLNTDQWDPSHVFYHVLDSLVDNYFPLVNQIDDTLNEIDENSKGRSTEALLKDLFDARHDLLSLRHTVTPMRDLLYRILNSKRLTSIEGKIAYFSDIYDHLLKLSEMIEASRELTTDIRDSYISINANETNHVMKVLTVITTIFMPLTFIVGIYGMNFHYMPELTWKYGYFGSLILMFIIAVGMTLWFTKKGWFK
ncbi:magnesium/cobalt transporter CorA [Neobacillus sp. OS1-2]|uniref:magnesium/cobalt transporter CorA n=1 Tax=Neobacillus sp. OS1-2 TaxID=3070680 RepID=UPI0027DFF74D|nr:magnesium/cobalt transporter CorA [Neobacillus sp. OS1-2]WML39270.1 magnesium/cobalt transporter CorA [Neobacillus sp. OS1-2]